MPSYQPDHTVLSVIDVPASVIIDCNNECCHQIELNSDVMSLNLSHSIFHYCDVWLHFFHSACISVCYWMSSRSQREGAKDEGDRER